MNSKRPKPYVFPIGGSCAICKENRCFCPQRLDDGSWKEDPANPKHYKDSKIEHWDVVDAWGLDYLLGNCTKYISRYQKKGKPLEDLRKAAVYLNRKIAQLEAEENRPPSPNSL